MITEPQVQNHPRGFMMSKNRVLTITEEDWLSIKAAVLDRDA